MKKILAILALAFAGLFAKESIIIGVTVPFDEILNFAKPLFAKKGYEIKIVEFTDFAIPNQALQDGRLDANLFQHKPYLDEFNAARGWDLVATTAVAVFPMGVYSKSIKDLKDLKDGAVVSVPNDPTNENRALEILQKAGLIELSGTGLKTIRNISKNPKKLKVREIKAAQLVRSLDDVAISVINTNYILDFGLNPLTDAIFLEDKDSPYANFVVVRKKDEQSAKTKAIDEILHSDEVRKFINEKYKGSVIPAF